VRAPFRRTAAFLFAVGILATPAAGADFAVTLEPATAFVHVVALPQKEGASPLSGTGTALTAERVLTACHVVAGARAAWLFRPPHTLVRAAFAETAPSADLCALRPLYPLDLTPVTWRATPVEPGEPITLIGLPSPAATRAVTQRVVSRHTVEGTPLVILDGPPPPGFSGGAAVDSEGRLVGVPVGRWAVGNGYGIVVAVGAIPSLATAAPRPPADTIPPFLEARHVWPTIISATLAGGSPPVARSNQDGNWRASWHKDVCRVTMTRQEGGPSPFELTLHSTRSGAVHWSVTSEAWDIPAPHAMTPLALTLLPSGKRVILLPDRLLQPPDQRARNTWNVRWHLDDALALLSDLPTMEGLVTSLAGQDLEAQMAEGDKLWDILRSTCLSP
jgi:hypothetical protein